jgi:adenine phosphoribosyltransferase
MTLEEKLKLAIRDVPDFPKEGIVFKDISPIMLDPKLSSEVLDFLVDYYTGKGIEAIAGVESRGFLFGYPLAMRLGVPFILIRKQGKLPYDKISHSYDLEYGSAVIEMHTDAISHGQNVLIHDDLLATGGSASASAALIHKCGGRIAGFSFLINLSFLNGSQKLAGYSDDVHSLISY